jgi:C4-dicarboxylate-specific signal transduction histidine kinase
MTSIASDPNLWVICVLVFLLGMLIGVFLTAGGRRKWKTRFNGEVERRKELEREQERRAKDMDEREKEWRERDSLRAAAIKDKSEPGDGEIRPL